ncbi:nuclear transport factor 2 family protein [Mycobacterium vicinigordonae]|uniref:Nuclear transport factor 2 family protein n=1 Tax=Mycobacterium vicinigordonae TaxID=1719132 RepID=A0A7D6HWE5_9MYCO|nr:nuclear transport factor 2 family protein [Mycobacterium vicinigordonae]QLL08473.1 nuclear transport factor 2 family protein [Mycobacterium vicinigordonae]
MSTHPFRAAVEAGRFDTIGEIFAENAVLHSPITRRPYRGRDAIALVVGAVATVVDDFRFVAELCGPESSCGPTHHAFRFTAKVDGLELWGCDFLHTGRAGLIDEITVMMRPLKAVTAFAARMREQLVTPG